jgi:hypothetical protein
LNADRAPQLKAVVGLFSISCGEAMKLQLTLAIIAAASLSFSPGSAHLSDPCVNNLLSETPSPDGKLILATYHRECRWKVLTVANVEKPGTPLGSRGEVVCYLTSWGDRHPIEAVWKNRNRITISTTDRLERLDFHGSKESCGNIKISYSVQFRNERQDTSDPTVISKIRSVLAETEPCITNYYKSANTANDPVKYMSELIDKGEHRSTVELILGYTDSASCPISPATYDSLKELSDTFDLKPHYLERVVPLVRH